MFCRNIEPPHIPLHQDAVFILAPGSCAKTQRNASSNFLLLAFRCPGATSRARTGDPSIFSAMLYQLSYRGMLTSAKCCGLRCASPKCSTQHYKPKTRSWWAMTDSNRRQPRCKRGALPTELIARGLVPRKGLEPLQDCSHYLLKVARLPFRHLGLTSQSINKNRWFVKSRQCHRKVFFCSADSAD